MKSMRLFLLTVLIYLVTTAGAQTPFDGSDVTVAGEAGTEVSVDLPVTTSDTTPEEMNKIWESLQGDFAKPVEAVVEVDSRLRVREYPWGPVLDMLTPGSKVTVTGMRGEFYKINYNGRTAYVHRNYISIPGLPASQDIPDSPLGYTVVRGDCLWNIAARFLGDGSRYWEIVELNKERYPSLVKNPNLIYPGWTFVLPGGAKGVPKQTESADTTDVPKVTVPSTNAKGGLALLGWLQQAGLSGENLRMAWSISMAESGGNPKALNDNPKTGDKSYGLFQINMINSLGPARRKQFGISSNDELFDPMTNIKAMLKVSGNCSKWTPWSVYKSGSYKKYYNQFPPK